MADAAVTDIQSKQLSTSLADLLVQAEADAVFMSDYGGNLIAHITPPRPDDNALHTIAALAAGSFCATRELAALIGEPTFSSVFHQGCHNSIFMQSVASNFLILVIFGDRTTPGLVKLYVEKTCQELEPILEQVGDHVAAAAATRAESFEMRQDDDVFGKEADARNPSE